MTTHEKLLYWLGTFTHRTVAPNTTVGLDNAHGYYLKLYDTYLLSSVRGIVTVNTGGFRTVTTKNRLNEFLGDGWTIKQRSRIWIWSGEFVEFAFNDGDVLDLHDYMHTSLDAQALQAQTYARQLTA